jgi:hypothetical protein
MRLLLLLAADYANVSREGKLNVMGIFNEVNSPDFPARHASMHLIVKLAAELGEYGQSRDLSVVLFDADGTSLLNYAHPIQIPKGERGRRPEVNAILEFKDIVFPKPGPYQFVVLVDRDQKGELTIYANKTERSDDRQV